jgi:hypothetical protein
MTSTNVRMGVVALLHTKCYLIIYKGAGKFFIAKDLDAYILNILFNYKVIKNRSGFPENALEKVIKGTGRQSYKLSVNI